MKSLFEPKTPISPLKERFRKICSAITDKKKVKEFFEFCGGMAIIILALIGLISTVAYLERIKESYFNELNQGIETNNATTYKVDYER